MARRRRQYLSDGDSSSVSSSSDQSSYGLGKHKRTKENAIYGSFADSDQENERQGGAGSTVKGTNRKGKKIDYRAGQAFVPSTGIVSKEKEGNESSSESENQYSEAEELARKPITEEEEIETRPAFASGAGPTAQEALMRNEQDGGGFRPASFVSSRGGIGSRPRINEEDERPRGGLGSRGGIGSANSSKVGIGAGTGIGSMSSFVSAGSSKVKETPPAASFGMGSQQHLTFEASTLAQAGVPTEFARPPPPPIPRKSKPPTPQTSIKFGTGLNGKFDPSAYLASMGWTGGGLGKSGEGIVNPIEVKLRPERAGIAFGGRKEKTKQAKEEARRRGEPVSSDEDRPKRKGKEPKKKEVQAWTKAEKKPRKPKIQHRTYEQIIEEAGGLPISDAGLGQIIDATGRELREVSSLASALANRGIPSESQHLPELRHNLRLICDNNLQTLTVLAKEGASIFERRKWLRREAEESQRRRDKEVVEVAMLKSVLEVVRELEKLGASDGEDLGFFDKPIERLVKEFGKEIEIYDLDEAVVGAIAPTLRRLWIDWDPLSAPTLAVSQLTRYLLALRLTHPPQPHMTPYETLLWTFWLPRLRTSLNNHFSTSRAINLIETWIPLLPRFILDNILDQLILPRVQSYVHDWTSKSSIGLDHIIFPWLPLFGSRLDDTLADAKRKVRSSLKSWKAETGIPAGLIAWRPLLSPQEWDTLLISTILPKLASLLRTELSINPASQELQPLEHVLVWKSLLPASMLSRLLESEFFPKWLCTLHAWLVQKDGRLDQVAEWYEFWKGWFPKSVVELEGVARGFERGLRLIDQAVSLGENRAALPLPDTAPTPRVVASLKHVKEDDQQVSFKFIVAETAAQHDLLLQPLNRLHPPTSLPLYRLSTSLSGKNGITFYISDDVIYLADSTPLSLSSLIEKSH